MKYSIEERRDIFGGSLAKPPPSSSLLLLPSSLLELEEAGNKKMRRPGMDDVTLDTETYYVTVVGHLQLSNYPISVSRAIFFHCLPRQIKASFSSTK